MGANFVVPPQLVREIGERREYRRFAVSLPAVIWRDALGFTPGVSDKSDALATRAITVNMSLMGMLFRAETAFPIGTNLWVRVWVNEDVLLLPCQVRQVSKEAEQGRIFYRYGVNFRRSPSTATALPILLRYLPTQSEADPP